MKVYGPMAEFVFGKVTASETLLIELKNEAPEQIADLSYG